MLHRSTAVAWRAWCAVSAARGAAQDAILRHWHRQRPRALRRAWNIWTCESVAAVLSERAQLQVNSTADVLDSTRADARTAQEELLMRLERAQAAQRSLEEQLAAKLRQVTAAENARAKLEREVERERARREAALAAMARTLQDESKRRVAAEAALRAVVTERAGLGVGCSTGSAVVVSYRV